MSRKLLLCCAITALSFTGCHKMRALFSHKATPTPEPIAVSNPEPAPIVTQPVATPAPAAGRTSNRNASVIALCYHVVGDEKTKALNIPTEDFEKEMQALKDNGFTVISMQDFLAWRRGDKSIPEKSALVTLDDGWISAYETAWPILKKFNYPFTIFIYIDYVNTGGKSMTWDQLAEMRDAGVDIEPHTYSHSNLRVPGNGVDARTAALIRKDITTLGPDGWLRKEVAGSKEALEQKLSIKCNVFAYPFGKYDAKVRAMVKDAGYEAAFTVYGQRIRYNSPFDLIGRYDINTRSIKDFDLAIKMIGGGVAPADDTGPDEAQLAASSMITEPVVNETIGNATPLIKANLATMGDLDAGSVKMRISGIGLVAAKYDNATKTITYQVTPSQKLKDPRYSVTIQATSAGKRLETQWSFNFDPTGKHVGPAPTPELPPR